MTQPNPTPVTYALRGGIAWISVDNPPVNALSHPVREGLVSAIDAAELDRAAAIILTCRGSTFIAGADIREIGQPTQPPALPELIQRIEDSKVPIVALMHGNVLGGGLEVALACHYRLAAPGTRFGLPEVKLGIIPGAGGTQRLPRLIGLQPALEMISSGDSIGSQEACAFNLIDDEMEREDGAALSAWIKHRVLNSTAHRRTSAVTLAATPEDREAIAAQRKIAGRKPQVLAPQRLCDALEAAYQLDFASGVKRERELFIECRDAPQSAAFRHLFFAERRASKPVTRQTAPAIGATGVIGGGTMGRGIAISLLDAGFPVVLLETDDHRLGATREAIEAHYLSAVTRGRIGEEARRQRLACIRYSTDYDALSGADLVIEAVFEDITVKQTVFRHLDAVCQPTAILASNTSFLDIDEIAAATGRPESVLGMHFFSPANIMKLLEIVRGDRTSDEAIARVQALGKACGKISVISGVCYGFIGNRINRRLGQQAQRCLLEGATPVEIDSAMEAFGMAMGPLAVGDLAGLDIGYMARKALSPEAKGDPETYWIPDALVEQGRLGQKSGSGYYRYEEGSRARHADDAVLALIESGSAHFGYQRKPMAASDIVERLLLSVVNEAARVLEEGIAQRPSDIDVVNVHGYGFPAHRGGALYWADTLGLQAVERKLHHFRSISGDDSLQPAPLIQDLATRRLGFTDM